MTGLLHMFLFVVILFSALILYAYLDHKRLRRKTIGYIQSKLGLYGVDFELTRFVRMARIKRDGSGEFIAVFPAHDRHMVIRDFEPGRSFDVPPDGVVLSDENRNISWFFLEQNKKVFYSRLEGFIPDSAGYIRRGAGKVVFGAKEIPGNIKDWFLVDPLNEKTGWLMMETGMPRRYKGLLLVHGFSPEEGELQDEGGRVILVDRPNGKFALRDGNDGLFRVYRFADILTCRTVAEEGDEEKNLLELKVDGEKEPLTFIFSDAAEATEWCEKFLETADKMREVAPSQREFKKLEPVPLVD